MARDLRKKALLFCRKEAKDFGTLSRAHPAKTPQGTKVFWFFFSKKNNFLQRHKPILFALAAITLTGAAPPPNAAVTIDNFAFTPPEITIAPGTTITWTNRDDIPHTVTGADAPRLFKSDPLDTDDHFAYRFDHAGRFAYFCSLHAHMQGVVIVK